MKEANCRGIWGGGERTPCLCDGLALASDYQQRVRELRFRIADHHVGPPSEWSSVVVPPHEHATFGCRCCSIITGVPGVA